MGSQDQTILDIYQDSMIEELLSFPELICKKRDGYELSKEEIQLFIDSVTNKSMQECQIGAMLMAIFMKGMTLQESSHMAFAMMNSGLVLKWPEEWMTVDKHSTGGVGDKITLPLAPALAACGVKVPMISGRGLGFTGGTLDKLESIPGYNVYHTAASMQEILEKIDLCIVGQTEALVPADKKLYATRDVTGTVECIPLITASIMSKKMAEGLKSLLLDVKTGRGAMLREEKDAIELAKRMVYVGNSIGIKVTAMLTDMDRPIGRMIGNALEIEETIECLHGGGPADTRELTEWQGGYLLYNVGKASSPEEGAQKIRDSLNNGTAMSKFRQLLKAQGVEVEIADKLCAKGTDLSTILPQAQFKRNIPALQSGYVEDIDSRVCAEVSYSLGAGRTKADEPVDHAVGLQLRVSLADQLKQGEPWITVHHNKPLPKEYVDRLQGALKISSIPLEGVNKSLIKDIIKV